MDEISQEFRRMQMENAYQDKFQLEWSWDDPKLKQVIEK